MTEQDLTQSINQGKELLIRAMAADGIISEEDASEAIKYYAIIVARKGWLGRIFDKARGITEDKMMIHVVKGCNYMNLDPVEPKEDVEESEKE
jgi:hypothetical protein